MINKISQNELDEVIDKLNNESKIYKEYKYQNRYYDISIQRIEVLKLANLFKFKIYESNDLPLFIDANISNENEINNIIVRSNLNSKDKKYIILYLISYYILHINEEKINYHTSNQPLEKIQRNKDAEYIARNLLVPKKELIKLKNHFHNPEFCTKIFGTDEDLINLRIKEIGYKNKTLLDLFKLKR